MDGPDRTREITVEVDERTAQQLEEIAWSFDVSRQQLLKTCCEQTVKLAD